MEPKLNLGDLSPKISKEARKEIGVATRIGLEQARARGMRVGRCRVDVDWEKVKSLQKTGLSERAAALHCGYSLSTFYKRKHEHAIGIPGEVPQDNGKGRLGPNAGNTYLVHAPSVRRVKIGYAVNVKARLTAIQTDSPVPVVLVCTFENLGFIFERYLQVKYDDYHVAGEWFDDKILSMIFEDPDIKRAMEQYAGVLAPEVVHYSPKEDVPPPSESQTPPETDTACDPVPIKSSKVTSEILVADITDLGSDPMSILEEIQRLYFLGVVPIALNGRGAPILGAKPEHWNLVMIGMQMGEELEKSWIQEVIDDDGDPFREQKGTHGRPRIDINFGAVEYFKEKGLSERKAAKLCGYTLSTFYKRKQEQKKCRSI